MGVVIYDVPLLDVPLSFPTIVVKWNIGSPTNAHLDHPDCRARQDKHPEMHAV